MYCYVILNNSLFQARCRALHAHPAPSRCKDTTKSFLPEIFAFTIFTVNITFINAGRALYAQPYGSAVPSSNAS